MIKKIVVSLIVVLVAAGLIFFNQLKDIRTEEVKVNFDEKRGLEILNQMAAAHGIIYWDSIQTYSLVIEVLIQKVKWNFDLMLFQIRLPVELLSILP